MGRTTRDTVSGWEAWTATWATWQIAQSEWFALSEWKWATRSVAPKAITIAQNHPSRSRVTLCLLPRLLQRKIIDLLLSPMSDEPQTKLQNSGKDPLPSLPISFQVANAVASILAGRAGRYLSDTDAIGYDFSSFTPFLPESWQTVSNSVPTLIAAKSAG